MDRTISRGWFNLGSGTGVEREMKETLRVGGANTLNVYTAKLTQLLLGWATFPWNYEANPLMDGVVIHFATLPGGSHAPYNEGDTATHEVGHWVGLLPHVPGRLRGRRPGGRHARRRRRRRSGARRDATRARSPGLDPIENFMDYTDDACMHAFTAGQSARASEAWVAYRA